jgi:hypothetical protein
MDYLTGFLIFAVVAALILGGLWYKGMYPFGNALTINPSGSVGANVMTSECPNGQKICYDGGYPHCCRSN